MFKKFQDVYVSVFFLGLAVVMYVATYQIKTLTVTKIGATFTPRLVAIAMMILSLILLITSILKVRGQNNPQSHPGEDNSQGVDSYEAGEDGVGKERSTKASTSSVLATIGLLILYIGLLPIIGFLIMTTVYLFLQMYLLAEKSSRKIPLFLGVSIVSSISIYYCFKSLFHLMLPSGILG